MLIYELAHSVGLRALRSTPQSKETLEQYQLGNASAVSQHVQSGNVPRSFEEGEDPMERTVLLKIPNDLYVVAAKHAHQQRMELHDYLLQTLVMSMTMFHDEQVAARQKERRRKSVSDIGDQISARRASR